MALRPPKTFPKREHYGTVDEWAAALTLALERREPEEDIVWHNMTDLGYQNSFADLVPICQYAKDPKTDMVYFRGALTRAPAPTSTLTIVTMPVGFRIEVDSQMDVMGQIIKFFTTGVVQYLHPPFHGFGFGFFITNLFYRAAQ